MARVILIAVFVGVFAITVWVVVTAVMRATTAPTVPPKPDLTASNAVWAEYYRRLAAHATHTRNPRSAEAYNSLAQTYVKLDDDENWSRT